MGIKSVDVLFFSIPVIHELGFFVVPKEVLPQVVKNTNNLSELKAGNVAHQFYELLMNFLRARRIPREWLLFKFLA